MKDRNFKTGPSSLTAEKYAEWYRSEAMERWRSLDIASIVRLAKKIESAAKEGRQIFVMGNGGSAATSSHIATDLSKTAQAPGKPPLRCIALTDNVAFITAIGNDIGYDQIFTRQLENLLNPGDIVILVSGSGNSPNVLEAARFARTRKAYSAALLGFDGGKLKDAVDLPILVDSRHYGVIEDFHMSIGHILAFFLRQRS